MRTTGLVQGLYGRVNSELLQRVLGAYVVRLQVAQDMMPICVLMDVVAASPVLFMAGKVTGVAALMGTPSWLTETEGSL